MYIDLNPLLLPQPGSRPIPGTDVSISSSVKVGSSEDDLLHWLFKPLNRVVLFSLVGCLFMIPCKA